MWIIINKLEMIYRVSVCVCVGWGCFFGYITHTHQTKTKKSAHTLFFFLYYCC